MSTSTGFADPIAISKKSVIYVGGLAEEVDHNTLTGAFLPFGELQQVLLPTDAQTKKHRGFAFVEFVDPEDAVAALENMNESELFGRVLKCNLAKPSAMKSGGVWNSAEEEFSGVARSTDDMDARIAHANAQESKARQQ